MKLSNAEAAIVPAAKLREYLLRLDHPKGRAKARILGQLGYSASDHERLAEDLRRQHLTQEASAGRPSGYGCKYEITATLTGPNGRRALLTTIWIVLEGEQRPRFVTALPGGRR